MSTLLSRFVRPVVITVAAVFTLGVVAPIHADAAAGSAAPMRKDGPYCC
jgi:hypothetical protein